MSSQRPLEISEAIFSQCNNFLALRLTNHNDLNYVKRRLPDGKASLVEKLPSLRVGECLMVGNAVAIPSAVRIDTCEHKPVSNGIPYFDLWQQPWRDLDTAAIKEKWFRK